VQALFDAVLDLATANRIEAIRLALQRRYGVDLNPFDVIEREKEAIRSGRHVPPARDAGIVSCIGMWLKKEAYNTAYVTIGARVARRSTSLLVSSPTGTQYERPIPVAAPDPEQRILGEERKQAVAELLTTFERDPVVQQVIECMLDGIMKPREIAAHLSMPVMQVYAAQRKLPSVPVKS
jgi:hypothetical protein